MAPLALAAHDVVLHENQIAFLEAFAPGELAAHFSDVTDIFVPHDHGGLGGRMCIPFDVRSTNPTSYHPKQSAILRNFRHGKIAKLRHARTGPYGCEYFFQRCFLRRGYFAALAEPAPLICLPARTSSA